MDNFKVGPMTGKPLGYQTAMAMFRRGLAAKQATCGGFEN
jgi:hypothetical protein